jgi:hypothetical protein
VDDEQGRILAFPQAPEAIELRHPRSFVAIAGHLNFGRAAARLYLSQPALSRLWEPVVEAGSAEHELEHLRSAYEALHAQFSPPPETDVLPVNANGVVRETRAANTRGERMAS